MPTSCGGYASPPPRGQEVENNTNQCARLQSSRFKMSLKRLIPLLDRVLVRCNLNLFHFGRPKSAHDLQVERLTAKTQIGGMCAPDLAAFPPSCSAFRRQTLLTRASFSYIPEAAQNKLNEGVRLPCWRQHPPRPNSSPNQVVISTGPGARDRDGWLLLATSNSFMFLSWGFSLLG